jgi:hypothetical protein
MKETKNSSIDFNVVVNKNILTARLKEYGFIDERLLQHHQISFSDGTTKTFKFYVPNENLIVEDEDLAYAEGVKNDIQLISLATKANFHQIFQHIIDGESVNIWVMSLDADPSEERFGIYYKNKYQFELCRVQGETVWLIAIRDNLEVNINEEVAERAGHLLNAVL